MKSTKQHPQTQQAQSKDLANDTPWEWLWSIVLALALTAAIELGLNFSLQLDLPGWGSVLLYLGCYFLVSQWLTRKHPPVDIAPHPASQWPVSGPVAKVGAWGMYFIFLPTLLLSAFNPWLLWGQLRQLVGQAEISKRLKQRSKPMTEYQMKARYRLPFDGEWLIYNGGLSPQTSHSWHVLTQRYAYDFVKADANFRRHLGKGNQLSDYYCYDQPILAAAAGKVVSVKDNIGNAPAVGYGVADFMCRHIAGNHIIIEHAENEYGFYAHLAPGSIVVKPGDTVEAGQHIGNCGHSGHSSEPHLHFHVQDSKDFYTAMGLPVRFSNVRRDGELEPGAAEIARGQRVSHQRDIPNSRWQEEI